MIKHIVMCKEDCRQATEFLRARAEALRDVVPGLIHLEIGLDRSRVDYARDVVPYTESESQAALDAYPTHPAHLRVRASLVRCASAASRSTRQ